ncbi:MAG: Na+/H+ antiporter NhaA, partial [Janthinobacterium lividum]
MPARPRLVLFGQESDPDTVTLADVLRRETVGGVLMLVAAAVALVWANVAPAAYEAVGHVRLGPLDLEHWSADGLLAIFFFVAGLELKRELTVGTLAEPAQALVPIVAAVCGMAVPALVCLAINLAPGGQPSAWAVPMATDIAFALAILAVVAPGLPRGLRAFLLTLAIVDDLGSILVIATVFTDRVSFGWLAGAAAVAVAWWLLQRRRVRGWYL